MTPTDTRPLEGTPDIPAPFLPKHFIITAFSLSHTFNLKRTQSAVLIRIIHG